MLKTLKMKYTLREALNIVMREIGFVEQSVTGIKFEDGSGLRFLVSYCGAEYFVDIENKTYKKLQS